MECMFQRWGLASWRSGHTAHWPVRNRSAQPGVVLPGHPWGWGWTTGACLYLGMGLCIHVSVCACWVNRNRIENFRCPAGWNPHCFKVVELWKSVIVFTSARCYQSDCGNFMYVWILGIMLLMYVHRNNITSVCPPKGGQGCLMSPPAWNLRAVIWFHFAISSLVLLPSPVTLSVLSFSACWSILLNFFQKILQ